jgi:hypothetical protein
LINQILFVCCLDECLKETIYSIHDQRASCSLLHDELSVIEGLELYEQIKSLMTSQFYQIHKDFTPVAKYLFEKAVQEIKTARLKSLRMIPNLLRQSSCLGNHESSFLLYAIYSFGIGVPKDSQLV